MALFILVNSDVAGNPYQRNNCLLIKFVKKKKCIFNNFSKYGVRLVKVEHIVL